MTEKRNLPPIVNLLYTHNPFYLISTCFVIYAIKQAFQPESGDYIDPWLLMASLSGFALLSAVTAWVIVRFGKVWEDARSIVLILVLMFLAISVSFDELLNLHPEQGFGLLLFGFCFSIAVSEGLLRGLQIRFPAVYRLPFYLILGLFFAFPYFVSPEVTGLTPLATRWRLLLFPSVAGLLALTLIPAVRRGSVSLAENGTPWKWPWFPWTVFAFLAFAVAGRSYYLNISFDESFGPLSAMYSAFGLYHLIPFALAVLIVLLEISLVEGKESLRKDVLVMAGLIPVLAIPFRLSDPIYASFHAEFTQTLAAPLFLSVWAVCGFFVYAWIRGVKQAEAGVFVALLAGSFVGPTSIHLGTLTTPNWIPLTVLCVLQFTLALQRRSSVRFFAGVAIASALIVPLFGAPDQSLIRYALPLHVTLLGAIACGLFFSDKAATYFKQMGAISLPLLSVSTAWQCQSSGVPEGWLVLYLVIMTCLPLGLWYFTRDRWYFGAGLANVAGGSGGLSWMGYRFVKYQIGADIIQPLLYGIAFFLIAVLISAHKAGAFERLFKKRNGSPPDDEALVARE